MWGHEGALLVWGFPLGHCTREAGICEGSSHPRPGATFYIFRRSASRTHGWARRRRQRRDWSTAVLWKYVQTSFCLCSLRELNAQKYERVEISDSKVEECVWILCRVVR